MVDPQHIARIPKQLAGLRVWRSGIAFLLSETHLFWLNQRPTNADRFPAFPADIGGNPKKMGRKISLITMLGLQSHCS